MIALIIHTANILGSFQDPFEFQGDYGLEVNPVREKVFELVISKEALSKNLTDYEVTQLMTKDGATPEELEEYRALLLKEAIEADLMHGPTLSEIVTPTLINALTELQETGFNKNDLEEILSFVNRYKEKKIFYFLRNAPSELLGLDKTIVTKGINLPILTSTQDLNGKDAEELKRNLLQQVFNENILKLTKPQSKINLSLEKLDPDFLQSYLGENAYNQELQIFSTTTGQVFFYWLYQSLYLQLISDDPSLIEEINLVKDKFARSLGDAQNRAKIFRKKIIAANSGVLFTQEADRLVPEFLTKDGLFHSVENQNSLDGVFVFLRRDLWEPDYQIIPLDSYEGYQNGRVTLILAKNIEGEYFLLASAHGNSTRAEDGRLQIALIKEKFEELAKNIENLQLVIGIDANTKTKSDVKALRKHLESLGLIGTRVGPTTIKRRMVTSQHAKTGRAAIDEEDYLITLKPDHGGRYAMTHTTVGFTEEKQDVNMALPNLNNPSDHYPVGATLIPLE